ncbi:hypothetical protein HQ590_16450 [bacterium]|nr:hypothetical protein [bacterium]
MVRAASSSDTSQTYLYTNNSAYLPSADVATNAYGAAPATVTLGAFASGWQDPTDPFALAAYDGAWDLGSNGTIRTTIPFTSTPSGPHQVSLFIDMIAYQDLPLYVTPTLSVSGTITNSGLITTTLDHVDPVFGGSWYHTTWSNLVVTLTDIGTVEVTITAAPSGGVVDALLIKTAATNPDSVGDGIPDWWRQQYFGGDGSTTNERSCATCDSDGTGQNNLFKYVAGLDPTNSASVFRLETEDVPGQPTHQALIATPAATGRTYTPWFTTDPGGPWSPLLTCVGPVTNGNQITMTDTNAVDPRKFYRIVISLP